MSEREPSKESPSEEPEKIRMTPWLWLLGVGAIVLGLICGLIMSTASLTR